jgi:hypothetical protein
MRRHVLGSFSVVITALTATLASRAEIEGGAVLAASTECGAE